MNLWDVAYTGSFFWGAWMNVSAENQGKSAKAFANAKGAAKAKAEQEMLHWQTSTKMYHELKMSVMALFDMAITGLRALLNVGTRA